MKYQTYVLWVAISIMTCLFFTKAVANYNDHDAQLEVVMRSIGHEVMLAHGDSTSRILPIEKEGNRYFIQFDTEFVFQASKLIGAVDKAAQQTDLVKNYLVEMRDCTTDEIIHSYQVVGAANLSSIPCGLREQPKALYVLQILLLEDVQDDLTQQLSSTQSMDGTPTYFGGLLSYLSWPITIILLIIIWQRNKKKEPHSDIDSEVIQIGNYLFDPRVMTLSLANKKVTLSGKESDLLSFLYLSVNKTVERDTILQNVWGDQGDYVGRTLDVFISKLRRKLEDDPTVKITSLRGVGYRLVVSRS